MTIQKSGSIFIKSINFFFRACAGLNLISVPVFGSIDRKASFFFDNLERSYIIHIPPSYKESVRMPLVIALHGRGGNAESMVLLTRKGFNRLADRDGFLALYPDGIEMNWNDGRMDEEANDRAHRENINDVGFISELIDIMIRDYNADPSRVYVTGMSNGAVMAYRLACELSHRIAAIAPVDGNIPNMLVDICAPSRPVPVLAINNTKDPLVPYEGGEVYGNFRRVKLGKVLSVDESVSFWVSWNQCPPIPVVTEIPDKDHRDGTRIIRKEYANYENGAEVILYLVDGGGHTWPGGLQYLPKWIIGKTSRDINATEVIWAFFNKHTR